MWQRLAHVLIDPRYKRLHLVVVVALMAHATMHYATYIPALREPLGGLPYFRLHVLHEAEFLLIVAYAGIVLGLRTGVAAVVITGLTSIPFILTPYIFGRDPRPRRDPRSLHPGRIHPRDGPPHDPPLRP